MGLFGKKASVPQYDYALIIDFVNGGQGHVYMMRTEAQVKMQEIKNLIDTHAVAPYFFNVFISNAIIASGRPGTSIQETTGLQICQDTNVEALVDFSKVVSVRKHPNF